MYRMEVPSGAHIMGTIEAALKMQIARMEEIRFEFNGVEVIVDGTQSAQALYREWTASFERAAEAARERRREYLATPEGRAETARKEEKARVLAEKRRVFEGQAKDGIYPFALVEGRRSDWETGLANNSDPYGRAVYHYASAWAFLMEQELARGAVLADIAQEASHVADLEGITGFMYGCAVSILANCWQRGEELRRWHNLKSQYGTEGEEANEKGGVLNPAIVTIAKKE